MGIGNRILIKAIKGKKEYQCALCGNRIEAGEHYTRATAQKDGKFITRKYCITHRWKLINADMREARANRLSNYKNIADDVDMTDGTYVFKVKEEDAGVDGSD